MFRSRKDAAREGGMPFDADFDEEGVGYNERDMTANRPVYGCKWV